MTGAELVLGLFAAASSGWGFTSGYGLEAGVESSHLRIMLSATDESKAGDSDYTYHGTLLYFLPGKHWALGGGITHYGYETEGWGKSATTPVVSMEYRSRHLVTGLTYTFEDSAAPSVLGLSLRSALGKHLWFTARVQSDLHHAQAGEIGLQWRL